MRQIEKERADAEYSIGELAAEFERFLRDRRRGD